MTCRVCDAPLTHRWQRLYCSQRCSHIGTSRDRTVTEDPDHGHDWQVVTGRYQVTRIARR